MANITSTDVNFAEVWCYRMVAKHQRCHYAPTDATKNNEG